MPTGKAPLISLVSSLFFRHLTHNAIAVPTWPAPAIAKIGKSGV